MFSTSFDEHVTGEESVLNFYKTDDDTLSDTFTMFVLSMVMASIMAVPVIIGTTQAAMMWRLLKKG
jgi:type III secretory pathway component EscT